MTPSRFFLSLFRRLGLASRTWRTMEADCDQPECQATHLRREYGWRVGLAGWWTPAPEPTTDPKQTHLFEPARGG